MRTSFSKKNANTMKPLTLPVVNSVETVKKSVQTATEPVEMSEFKPRESVQSLPHVDEADNIRSMIIEGCVQSKVSMDSKDPRGNSTQEVTTPIKKGRNTKISRILIVMACLIAVVGSFFAGKYSVNVLNPVEETVPYESKIGEVSQKVDSLYADYTKSSLADGVSKELIEGIQKELNSESSHGVDTKRWDSELSTILKYIEDDKSLSKYENSECLLSQEALLQIKSSANEYVVEGLKSAANKRVDSLMSNLSEFERIKSELLGVSDLKSLDIESYSKGISVLNDSIYKEYLVSLLGKLGADKDVLLAEETLKGIDTDADGYTSAEESLSSAKKAQADAISALEGIESKIRGLEKEQTQNNLPLDSEQQEG